MNVDALKLDQSARIVFSEVKEHKALPLLEISAVTGIRDDELRKAINELVRHKLVTWSRAADWANSIVSLSGSCY